MSRIRLMGQAAVIALGCGLGGAVMAQNAVELPEWLQELQLQDIQTESKRRGGHEIEGRLPDGGKIEVRLDARGNVIEVEADDAILPQAVLDAVLPADLQGHAAMSAFSGVTDISFRRHGIRVEGEQPNSDELELVFDGQGRLISAEADDEALPQMLLDLVLPQAVMSSDALGQLAEIQEIGLHGDSRFRIEGEDASGKDIRMLIDHDGRLLRFGREDEGRKRSGWQERRGDARPGHFQQQRPAFHHGQRGPLQGRAQALDFDPVQLNQRLSDAGYSDFGLLRRAGPALVLEAQNPAGESVILQLDSQGQIIRETAR